MATTTPTKTSAKNDLSVHTTDHPNALRTREAFAAFARGDLDTVRGSMRADCAWTNAGTGPLAGTYRGWDAIAGMFGEIMQRSGGTFAMDVLSTLADDARSVTVYDATSTVNGVKDTQRFVLVDEIDADGKITATQVIAYDQQAADRHLSR